VGNCYHFEEVTALRPAAMTDKLSACFAAAESAAACLVEEEFVDVAACCPLTYDF
jgi:hypothetical protein